MANFKDITTQMVELYVKKNQDYGNSFDETLDEFGLVAGIIRMNDKIKRIKQLYKSGEINIKEEKVEDTLIDLANYAVMTLSWLKKDENKR